MASSSPRNCHRAFFENIHKKTGTVLPEDPSLFEKTIIEGIKRAAWVLIQQDKAYTQENPPSRVTISSDSRLLLPDEAGRQNFTDLRGHLCRGCSNWPCQCKKKNKQQPHLLQPSRRTMPIVKPEWENFEPAPVKIQIDDLEKWIRRESIDKVTETKIIITGTTDAATQFRNLLRLAKAGKKVSTTVEVKARNRQTNVDIDIAFKADDAGLRNSKRQNPRRFSKMATPEFQASINLKAEMPISEVAKVLKNTLKTDDSNLKLALNLKPQREK